jgi:hypothetical protein
MTIHFDHAVDQSCAFPRSDRVERLLIIECTLDTWNGIWPQSWSGATYDFDWRHVWIMGHCALQPEHLPVAHLDADRCCSCGWWFLCFPRGWRLVCDGAWAPDRNCVTSTPPVPKTDRTHWKNEKARSGHRPYCSSFGRHLLESVSQVEAVVGIAISQRQRSSSRSCQKKSDESHPRSASALRASDTP